MSKVRTSVLSLKPSSDRGGSAIVVNHGPIGLDHVMPEHIVGVDMGTRRFDIQSRCCGTFRIAAGMFKDNPFPGGGGAIAPSGCSGQVLGEMMAIEHVETSRQHRKARSFRVYRDDVVSVRAADDERVDGVVPVVAAVLDRSAAQNPVQTSPRPKHRGQPSR